VIRPGDTVLTKERWGFLTLSSQPDITAADSDNVGNLQHDQPALVLAVTDTAIMVMVPKGDGGVWFGWREKEQFRLA